MSAASNKKKRFYHFFQRPILSQGSSLINAPASISGIHAEVYLFGKQSFLSSRKEAETFMKNII